MRYNVDKTSFTREPNRINIIFCFNLYFFVTSVLHQRKNLNENFKIFFWNQNYFKVSNNFHYMTLKIYILK